MTGATPLRDGAGALTGRRVLVIGAGGLGCPALLALVGSGATLVVADDDVVDITNLHRQIVYEDADVGADKLQALQRAFDRLDAPPCLELVRSRFLPENARELAGSVDLILEGSDNYATKFLAADAAALCRRPIVHGAAVRWVATALAVAAQGRPCYRCLFEDVPMNAASQSCAEAGVVGPVVGFAGALMADLAFRVLTSDVSVFGGVQTYDGKADRLRRIAFQARSGCALCGSSPSIFEIDETRYTAPSCAA